MKLRIVSVFMLLISSLCSAQTLDFKKVDFSTSAFSNEELTAFEFTKIATPLPLLLQQNDSKFSMLDTDTDFKIDSEALNTTLFSNLKLSENDYQNNFNYIRGCGPLEGGLTHTVNSSDIMISKL
ncbi:hypothetical protein [Winogradskyella costae]|uniref:hypothetical protein n=1 Tax=Winogradskyella costae TaxID=2697008 RepID=UPI0015C7FA1F|nr:hypothetical protein [Winogradskyella costae]